MYLIDSAAFPMFVTSQPAAHLAHFNLYEIHLDLELEICKPCRLRRVYVHTDQTLCDVFLLCVTPLIPVFYFVLVVSAVDLLLCDENSQGRYHQMAHANFTFPAITGPTG